MTFALVAVGAFVAACVQATSGLGFALILTPVLFALMSPVGAILTTTGLGIVLNVLVLFAERRRLSVAWSEVVPILAAAAPGSVLGLLLLRALPKPVLQIVVGIAVIAAALLRLRGHLRVHAHGAWQRAALGFTTGTFSTSTGVSGPPVALWLSSVGLQATAVRDSLSATFLGLGILTAVTLLPVIGDAHVGLSVLVAAVASVVAGHAIGSRLFARLTTNRFELLLLAIIFVAGATSLALGVDSL
jgi:uncharacterized membrane protein YfcA